MKIIRIGLLLLSTSMLFSACRITKDVALPNPALPVAFRNAPAADDTASAGDISWKTFFTDAALQQLIDSAIVRNYDMQLAAENMEQAHLLLRQSKWGYAPDVNLQVNAGISRPSDNSLNGLSLSQFLGTSHIEDYTAAVGLSWEADIWGKVRNQKRSALAAYLQSEEARKGLQTRLIASVAAGYYNLLMLDEQLAVARKNLALNDSTLTIIRLQYDAGQVTALGVQQAEAQRLTAAQLIPQLGQDMTIQENALNILAGRLPDNVTRAASLNDVAVPTAIPSGLPVHLLSRRPDVKSSELALTVSNAQVGIARANMYPTLNITASGGVNAFKFTNWFSIPASLFGIAAGSLTQPLLQRRQLQTRYHLAQVEREKTVIRFRQTLLNAVGEVSDVLVQTEQIEKRYIVAAQRVEALQTAISSANLLFKNGMATYLEVITAQANLLQSELELSAIRRNQLSASVELYRALGGGWQ